ncbi:MAG: flagellar hook-associated protein FlgK [Candidatus Omnitrophica bacterium]|nr:flagellar hook-associated protein FlgK [Candidatus Omnitrophota bacterium]
MVSLFGILNIGSQGISASQASLDTTANNIANANTEGYSRQRTVQQTLDTLVTANGVFGQGVNVVTVERIRNRLLEAQVREALGDTNFNQQMGTVLAQLESIFSDPLHSVSSTTETLYAGGLNDLISSFFRAFQDLSTTPDSPELRIAAIESAQALAESIVSKSQQLITLRMDLNQQIGTQVQTINQALQEIAGLNGAIRSVEAGGNRNANELRDRRDLLLRQISELVPVQVVEGAEGMVRVSIAGQWIVDHTSANPLVVETSRNEDGIDLVGIRIGGQGLHLIDNEVRKGKLGAILEARDRLLPALSEELDVLARGVIFEVNRLHSASSGLVGYSAIRSSLDVPSRALDSNSTMTLNRVFNEPAPGSRSASGSRPYPIQDGEFTIRVTDSVDQKQDTYAVVVNTDDTLAALVSRIDRADGIVSKAQSAFAFDPVFAQSVQSRMGVKNTERSDTLASLSLAAGTALAVMPGDYSFEIHIRDAAGSRVDADPASPENDPFVVQINSGMTLDELANQIQAGSGGRLRADWVSSSSDPSTTWLKIQTVNKNETFSIQNDNSGLIAALAFPLTDPTVPLVGGTATSAQFTFSGAPGDSFLGSGHPAFSPAFPGPPPCVIQTGSFELVVLDENLVPTSATITISTSEIDSLTELRDAIQAADPHLSVTITEDRQFQITAADGRSFFFQNDTTGLIQAMGFSDIQGYGRLGDQVFQDGSFEIVVANAAGLVTHILEVPVSADPSHAESMLTLNRLVEQINRSAENAGAPVRASLAADPQDPNRWRLQVEALGGSEFTFRSDDSLILSALGFAPGPVLNGTGDNPILGAETVTKTGDTLGGLVRARIQDGQIEIATAGRYQIMFTGDTSHFLAAAGINTLFTGTSAKTMAVNNHLLENYNLLAVSSDGSRGNNDTALAIADLENRHVLNGKTIGEHYRGLVTALGGEGNQVSQRMKSSGEMLRQLEALQEQESGVSLDEESIDIIRFQQAFQASAKIIATVDELMNVIINRLGS